MCSAGGEYGSDGITSSQEQEDSEESDRISAAQPGGNPNTDPSATTPSSRSTQAQQQDATAQPGTQTSTSSVVGTMPSGKPLSSYPSGSTYCGDFVCSSDGKQIGIAPPYVQGVRSDESLGDALMFVPVEKLAAPLAGAAAKLGGDLAAKAAEAFFARGGKGLLNSNDFSRIGYGWQGSATAGSNVLRIGIGSKRLPIHIHITLWKF